MQNLVWTKHWKQGPTLISTDVDPPRVEFITYKLFSPRNHDFNCFWIVKWYKTESLQPVYRIMVLFKKEKHHNSFHKATSFAFLLIVIDEGDETYMIMIYERAENERWRWRIQQ